jgi:hypothetical protein
MTSQNPAQLSTATENTEVVRTTIATEQVAIDGQTYPGKTSRYRSSAPTLEEAALRAEQMFTGEPDAQDFTAAKVEALLTQFGRYVGRFHTVMAALAAQEA